MKIKKADSKTRTLKLEAEHNRDLKALMSALVAGKLDCDDWNGWVDASGAKIRYNSKTRRMYYAAKIEDNSNKYLFDHIAGLLAKYCFVDRSEVKIENRLGKQLDIYMGGSSRYYCASFTLSKNAARQTAALYYQTSDHFMKLITTINSTLNDDK